MLLTVLFIFPGNYLKTGKLGHKQIIPENEANENEVSSLNKAAESLAASWLEQSMNIKQQDVEPKKQKRSTVINL